MLRFIKKTSNKIGLSPGTLVHIGERKIEKTRIRIIDYDQAQFQEKEVEKIEEYLPFKDEAIVTWTDVMVFIHQKP